MNYRSVADLNRAVQEWSSQLPDDIALVVGVPRSGMLAAMLLALHRNLPVTDLDRFLEGRVLGAGARSYGIFDGATIPTHGAVLIVDDTTSSGREMRRVKGRIRATGATNHHHVRYGAVYVTYESISLVDHWYEVLNQPRVFEWNLMHSPALQNACIDIDGVLCRDPTEMENDDGDSYREFVSNVRPMVVPTCEIGFLVTCRLEKYRSQTEAWLKAHRFRYRELVMMDMPDKAARRMAGSHGAFKATQYLCTKADLFIESSKAQATEIARLSGKPVYCMECREMILPGRLLQGVRQPGRLASTLLRDLKQGVKGRLLRSTVGRQALRTYRRVVFRSESR